MRRDESEEKSTHPTAGRQSKENAVAVVERGFELDAGLARLLSVEQRFESSGHAYLIGYEATLAHWEVMKKRLPTVPCSFAGVGEALSKLLEGVLLGRELGLEHDSQTEQ